MIKLIVILFSMLFCMVSFGQVVPLEDATTAELIEQLIHIITNWKAGGTLLGISMIIILLTNVLKSQATGFLFEKLGSKTKRIVIVVMGVLTSVITLKLAGTDWISAIVTGLITSGGAVAIYEAFKPVAKK